MRYAFFGTPEFAAIVLEKLISAGFPPSLLVCNPDRPVGRKKIVTPPPAKQSILEQSESIREEIEIVQPEKVREIETTLRSGDFDFFVIAAYGKIIPNDILEIPKFGTIGVHPSLLPLHRGSSPVQSTILNGDKETGVTLYMVDALVDHGPVLSEKKLELYDIASITYPALHDALAKLGADMLIRVIPKIGKEQMTLLPQDESKATFTKKFVTEDGFVDEVDLEEATNGNKEKAVLIDRKIRALNPEPGVYTIRKGERTKLLEAELRDGALVLKTIQIAGKMPQRA